MSLLSKISGVINGESISFWSGEDVERARTAVIAAGIRCSTIQYANNDGTAGAFFVVSPSDLERAQKVLRENKLG
jgi:hypothetical protein